jgi:hypothetical protein
MSGDYLEQGVKSADMFGFGNVVISTSALASLGLLCYKIKKPFKQHSFNTFAYIILLLIVYALFGKMVLI